jgi:uncharacterized protein (TIGR03437 family)
MIATPACVAQTGVITTVAGTGEVCCTLANGFPATTADLATPRAVSFDSSGNLYIAETGNLALTGGRRLRVVSPDGTIETALEVGGSLATVSGVATDARGNIYVTQTYVPGLVLKRSPGGRFEVLAGIDSLLAIPGPSGEDVPAKSATLDFGLGYDGMNGLVADAAGNVYVAETGNHRVRRISTSGQIRTVAGQSASAGFAGDGGAATSARLNGPSGLAMDTAGNLYIADTGNHRIRMVSPDGTIRTIAGASGPSGGFGGDGGPAISAQLRGPQGMALHSDGTLFVADTGNHRVRRIAPNRTITTIAGMGRPSSCVLSCFGGDGQSATAALLSYPMGLALDGAGNLYIADSENNRIRRITFGAAPGSGGPPPVIATNGVVNAASFAAGIVSGSWVAIFGRNLAGIAAPGRTWLASEIINGILPTSLEGVSVNINGKPAAVYFVGPEQLNVQAPDDDAVGPVEVEVITPAGRARATAELRRAVPAMFTMSSAGGILEVAAVHLDGTPAGNRLRIQGAREARRGETILMFGTGFGPTNPLRPAGQVVTAAPLAAPFSVRIGGLPATATFGGLAGAGLYQFNVVIPNVPNTGRPHPVVIESGGARTQENLVLWIN